jgi:hypothetical protein
MTQTIGDCKVQQCDGNGNAIDAIDDGDLPTDDGTACTAEACSNGSATHPPLAAGTSCNENGGIQCNGSGACVECLTGGDCASSICVNGACAMATCNDGVTNGGETGIDCGGPCAACPHVASTTPPDASIGVATNSTISVIFNAMMAPLTLTAQTAAGPCTGSIQVSGDDFATCIGFASGTPVMSVGDSVATLTPALALAFDSTYKIKVTPVAMDPKGNPVTAYASATGFTTSAM